MEFVACNARIARGIEEKYEAIHEVKKTVFVDIIVGAVKPIYFIAAQQRVVLEEGIIAHTRQYKLLIGIKIDEIAFKMSRKGFAQKIVGYSYFIVNKTINEAIKYGLQRYIIDIYMA